MLLRTEQLCLMKGKHIIKAQVSLTDKPGILYYHQILIIYIFSLQSSSFTPTNWTEANADGTNPVSKTWTSLGTSGNLRGWQNVAYAWRSTDAITAGKYITATRNAQQVFLVAKKDS